MGRKNSMQPGQQVGQWTLLEYVPGCDVPRIAALWHCRCSCGVEREVQASNLRTGASKSCGHDRAVSSSQRLRERWAKARAANDESMDQRDEERWHLGMAIAGEPHRARRIADTLLVDVALDGRRAVHRRRAGATPGTVGRYYGEAANDAKGRKRA